MSIEGRKDNRSFNIPVIQGNTNVNMIPTGAYNDLTWKTDYTAPADGWVAAQLQTMTSQAFLGFTNKTTGMTRYQWSSTLTANVSIFLPVRKGDVIASNATNMIYATGSYYRFYYAQNYGNSETKTIIKY